MTIPRTRKPKKKETHRPAKTPFEIVKMANYVNIAALVRTLWTVYGWREKRIAAFLESHLVLLEEATRFGVNEMIRDTEELTGVNVQKLFDEICEGGSNEKEKK